MTPLKKGIAIIMYCYTKQLYNINLGKIGYQVDSQFRISGDFKVIMQNVLILL